MVQILARIMDDVNLYLVMKLALTIVCVYQDMWDYTVNVCNYYQFIKKFVLI